MTWTQVTFRVHVHASGSLPSPNTSIGSIDLCMCMFMYGYSMRLATMISKRERYVKYTRRSAGPIIHKSETIKPYS